MATPRIAAILSPDLVHSPLYYKPSQTALLLLDYQGFVVTRNEACAATVPVAMRLRDWAVDQGILVAHCLVGASFPPLETYKGIDRISGLRETVAKEPTIGEEDPRLAPVSNAKERELVVYRRPGIVSPFYSEGLRDALEKNGIKSLIVAGLATGGVVLSAVRAGSDEGFVMTVVKNACADLSEEQHRILIDNILPMQAHIMSFEELSASRRQS